MLHKYLHRNNLKALYKFSLIYFFALSQFTSLSALANAETINKSKGIYTYVAPYLNNGEIFTSPIITSPSQVKWIDDVDNYVDGVVLLLYWSVLCPRKGECNFEVIDSAISHWSNKGKKVGLNIATVGYPIFQSKYYGGKIINATPKWVMRTAKTFERKTTIIEKDVYKRSSWEFPFYSDKNFQDESINLIKMLGKKYNKDTNVSFVRIGTGVVGEENPSTNGQNNGIPNFTNISWYDYVKMMTLAYINAFPDKELELDIVWAGWVYKYGSQEDVDVLNKFISLIESNNIVIGFNGMRATSLDELTRGSSPHAHNLNILNNYRNRGKSISLEGYGPPWDKMMTPYRNLVSIVCELKPVRVNFFGSFYQFANFGLNDQQGTQKTATEILAGRTANKMELDKQANELRKSLLAIKACVTN